MSKSEKEIPQNSNYNIKNRPETKDLNDKQKDRLYRNAALMGLIKINKITWQDLIISNGNIASKKDELEKTLVSINNMQCYILISCITLH